MDKWYSRHIATQSHTYLRGRSISHKIMGEDSIQKSAIRPLAQIPKTNETVHERRIKKFLVGE